MDDQRMNARRTGFDKTVNRHDNSFAFLIDISKLISNKSYQPSFRFPSETFGRDCELCVLISVQGSERDE